MSLVRLSDTEIGKSFKIVSLACEGELKQKLSDLGFLPGTTVKAAFKSPLGKPYAYLICGTLIALRDYQAKKI